MLKKVVINITPQLVGIFVTIDFTGYLTLQMLKTKAYKNLTVITWGSNGIFNGFAFKNLN